MLQGGTVCVARSALLYRHSHLMDVHMFNDSDQ
jgi:hypothetical protein